MRFLPLAVLPLLMACSSGTQTSQETTPVRRTFGYDLDFLRQHDPALTVLSNADSSAQVIVSAQYQGKVFTSTATGLNGTSFGWINYSAFTGKPQAHMNAYGGENRLWLGPEGAQYSLYFKPGVAMEFANWQTPPAFDTESWNVISKRNDAILMDKRMALTNYAGTQLTLRVDRTVQLLTRKAISQRLSASLNDSIRLVGYQTTNTLTNTGQNAWTKQTGAPCVWMLDMLVPGDSTTILIPYERTGPDPIATTNYFGAIPPDRIQYRNGVLHFKADGKSRGKLGLTAQRAKPMAGSYDSKHKILTLTFFDVDKKATYLNQEWKLVPEPFKGDLVNAYNDGPLADGSQMGPFYELESVSPAAFLKPGASLIHRHMVLHLTGNETQLNAIAQKVLGVSLR